MEKLNINDRVIGPGEPPYIIAEIGSNHNGDIRLAKELISAAAEAGADAVKFQSWTKGSLMCRAELERNTEYADKHRHFGTLDEMCQRYQLTMDQHNELVSYCAEKSVTFLSSSFSPEEVDLLDSFSVPCFKVASMDVNHLSLLEHTGKKGKPVILSTGMANLGEIERAVEVLHSSGSGPLALLHCVAIYPPKPVDINLRNIKMLQRAFNLPVGFSDHTIGTAIPLAAVAIGACIIEKHFTLNKDMEGWDHWISATPEELSEIVSEGRNIYKALGSSVRKIGPDEQQKKKAFRRRIVLKRAKKKGDRINIEDLDFKRPGNGIHPDEVSYILGRALLRDMETDEELEWEDMV